MSIMYVMLILHDLPVGICGGHTAGLLLCALAAYSKSFKTIETFCAYSIRALYKYRLFYIMYK